MPVPAHSFAVGLAEGNVPKATTEATGLSAPAKRTKWVNTCAAIMGPNGVVRTSFSIGIDSAAPSGAEISANWADYDAFMGLCQAALDRDGSPAPQRVIAELHWNWKLSSGKVGYHLPFRDAVSGHPTYIAGAPARLQGMASWYDWVRDLVLRYGDSIFRYEIWNEPDTPTGNANGSQTSGYMNPADVYELARAASMAIADAWAAGGFPGQPVIMLPAIGAIETSYLRKIVEYGKGNGAAGTWVVASSGSMVNPVPGQPHLFSFGDVMPFHVYMSEAPSLAGGAAGSPSGTSDQYLRRIKTLATRARPYLDSEGFTASVLKLGTTEGGYRGNDTFNYDTEPTVSDFNPDVQYAKPTFGRNDQATWERAALDWLASVEATLGLDVICHYKLVDKNPSYPTVSSKTVRHNALGVTYDQASGDAAIGSSHWKPTALVYSEYARSQSTPPPPPPPPPAPSAPVVAASGATLVADTSAQLNGTVNPEGLVTTFHWEYGPTTGYGTSTPTTSAGSGGADVVANVALSGLAAGTTYHARLVATSSAGTTDSADVSFTTAAAPVPPPPTPPPPPPPDPPPAPAPSPATAGGGQSATDAVIQWRFGFYDRWSGGLIGNLVEPKDPEMTFQWNGIDQGAVTVFIDDPILSRIATLGTVVKVWRQVPGWSRDPSVPDLCGILGPMSWAGATSQVKLTFFSPAWLLQARFLWADAAGVKAPFVAAPAGSMLAQMLAYTNKRGATHITSGDAAAGPTFTIRPYPVGQQIWQALTDLCGFEIDLRPQYHHAVGDTDLMRLSFVPVRGTYRPSARIDYRIGRDNCDDAQVDFTPELGRTATFIHAEGEGGTPEFGDFAVPEVDTLGLLEKNVSYQDVQTFNLVRALAEEDLAQARQIPVTFTPTLSAVNPPVYGRDFEVGDLLPCAAQKGQLNFAQNLRAQTATLSRTDGGAERLTVTLATDYDKAVAV